MLRCARCNGLNCEDHRFCQQCGTALVGQPLGTAGSEASPSWGDMEAEATADITEAGDEPTLILPQQLVYLESGGLSDGGRDRYQNEDYFLIEQQVTRSVNPDGPQVQAQGIYILCDGMGGHAAGEVASALAANTLLHHLKENWQHEFPSEANLKAAMAAANQAVYSLNEAQGLRGRDRMGTTVVLALVQDTQVYIAHVGDSRLYRVTLQRGLEQLTVDHEIGQRDIDRGIAPEIAYAYPDAYQLTQALGLKPDCDLYPDIQTLVITDETLLLLCSDGMTDNDILDTHADSHLMPLLDPQADLNQGVQQLIHLANQQNGHDNITAIAIRMGLRLPSLTSIDNPGQDGPDADLTVSQLCV